MEERNIEELLSEEIAAEIQALSGLNSGSKEKSTAIDDLTKLYKLRIEENKSIWDADEVMFFLVRKIRLNGLSACYLRSY